MSSTPHSPPDEYERQLAQRGQKAFREVALWYGLTVVPYVAVPFTVLCPGLPAWAPPAALVTFGLFAFATGVVTLRNWPVLSRGRRLFGLAPWAMCVLMASPFVLNWIFQ